LVEVKTLVDNDHVRVIEVRMRPGEKSDMHSHPAYVTYVVGGAKLKISFPDGSVQERTTEKGTAAFSNGLTHSIENIGSTEMISIDIELKK